MASVFSPFAFAAAPLPVKVLLIGDSLSVGGFGDGMQASLLGKYGPRQVAIYASCGSSPEDWIKGGFVTPCGYRQTTPAGSFLHEYRDGVRPHPVKTPALRTVLGHYRPQMVIVQLGTNWMDALAETSHPDATGYRRIISDFVRQLQRANPAVEIFWVLPPASSKYPARVHKEVENWINEASHKLNFHTINSRRITGPYRAGKSGGDGVHYREVGGGGGARGVYAKLAAAAKAFALAQPPARP